MTKVAFGIKSYFINHYFPAGIQCKIPFLRNCKFKMHQDICSVTTWHKQFSEIVETEQGKVWGRDERDYKGAKFYSFQGIPYAKPPVGGLRFKAALPPEPWRGVKEASKPGNDSLASHYIRKNAIVGSEDCLYLNVYAPQLLPTESNPLKPVMFWIYGGCFVTGSSRRSVYGPEILMTGNVVLVTTNYRLGLLGFLSMQDPILQVPGNAGIKDIVMALTWVRKNIEKFGGDPKNVTVFGGSAGAAAVHSLILSPMAKGLFHRAILQSGCLFNPWMFGSANAAVTTASVLGYDGKNETNILNFLRSVPAKKLIQAQIKIPNDYGGHKMRSFGIVVEKNTEKPALLPEAPLDIIKSGNYNKVPIMIGYASREGMYIEAEHVKLYGKLKMDDFETKIPYFLDIPKGSELSLKIANQLKEAYFGSSVPSLENIDEYFKLETDFMILRGIYKTIVNHLATLNTPIYFYVLSADTKRNYFKILNKLARPGTCHADDIGYLFKSELLPIVRENSIEERIIQRIVQLWTNFARTGDPNPTEKNSLIEVTWKPVEKDHFNCLNIGSDLNCSINEDLDRMKTWNDISTLASNENL